PRAGDETLKRADVFDFAVDDVVDRCAGLVLAVADEMDHPCRRIERRRRQGHRVCPGIDHARERLAVPVQIEDDVLAIAVVRAPVAAPTAFERMSELRRRAGGDGEDDEDGSEARQTEHLRNPLSVWLPWNAGCRTPAPWRRRAARLSRSARTRGSCDRLRTRCSRE